jgi:DJ-1/PfpI family/Alpha/beta hydrolase domain
MCLSTGHDRKISTPCYCRVNPDSLRIQPAAVDFVRAFFEDGKPVAAICHGPWTLIETGQVQGRRITSWPSLMQNLAAWIKDGTEPPPSARPTIAAGTLVAPDQVHFPPIPANRYGDVSRPAVRFLRLHNPLHPQDYGEDFHPEQASGAISVDPPKVSPAPYGTLVAQVDADGNDLDGIRNVFVQVPIGTYTGWNLFNRSFYEDGFCTLQGSFIPFARTKAERITTGDPRLSIEERYPSKEMY